MEQLLSSSYEAIGSIATWIGVLAGGSVLTYYVLPHMSGKIHGNAMTFIWVTALLAVWTFVIQTEYVDPLISILRYFLSMTVYKLAAYSALQAILDTLLTILAAWTIKIAFFPDQHHSTL